MVTQVVANMGWAISFTVIGAIIGIALIVMGVSFLPRIINRSTPDIDEGKEILRGNVAVAEYYGRIVASSILGLSIIIAAAVLGGILSGLHG